MRKVLFLSLLVVALTGFASANTVYVFSGTNTVGGLYNGAGTSSAVSYESLMKIDGGITMPAVSSALLTFDAATDSVDFSATFAGGSLSFAGKVPGFTIGPSPADCTSKGCDVAFTGTAPGLTFNGFVNTSDNPNSQGFYKATSLNLIVTQTPEPESLSLLGCGIAFLVGGLRKKR